MASLRARWIYLRVLGVCLGATFVSVLLQVRGLIGREGVFPARETLLQAGFWKSPSLFWISASDTVLVLVCAAGIAGAFLVLGNRWNRLGLFLCWLSFLSFASAAPQLTWYKADGLLLEQAFLGWFLAPKGSKPGLGEGDPPSRVVFFAHLWLLFRLMLETGMSKVFGGDPAWRDLSAMAYFHETMPFPTWAGWFFAKLPYVFQRAETAFTLAVEVLAPFLLFFGRRSRIVACALWCVLQAGILLSGNFLTFNYQAIGLGILLMGGFWDRMTRKDALHAVVLVPHAFIGLALLLSFPVFPNLPMPGPVVTVLKALAPFRSANQYILYPFIDKERRVVVLEGSDDGGATWHEYGHRWQTQKLDRAPRFLAPLSDRFEREFKRVVEEPNPSPYWQDPFIFRTASALLEGSPRVSRLFAEDPFAGGRPDRIRATIYRYQSTDLRTLWTTGDWWTRRKIRDYCPVIARDPGTGKIDYVDSP